MLSFFINIQTMRQPTHARKGRLAMLSHDSPERAPSETSWVVKSPMAADFEAPAWASVQVDAPSGGWGPEPYKPGTSKRGFGKRIIRDPPEGMDELKEIVLKLRRDITLLHGTQSLKGAKRFVDKNPGQGYAAYEEDLNADGIPEVFVKKGDKFILINGYTTKQSDWAKRQQYYSTHDTRATRKAQSMKQWLHNDIMHARYDDEDPRKLVHADEPGWNAAARTYGYRVTKTLKNLTPYQVYAAKVVAVLWPYILDHHKDNPDISGIKRSYIQVVARSWNMCILSPVLEEYINDDAVFRPLYVLLQDRKRGGKEELKLLARTIKQPVVQEHIWARIRNQMFTISTSDPSEMNMLLQDLGRVLQEVLEIKAHRQPDLEADY